MAVAGVAGSGKSTLGRALATALRAPMLDLDSNTNPLLDSLPAEIFGGHWLASPHGDAVRAGRYAALLAVTRDTVSTAGRAVLVAPFTAELRGGTEWDLLREASGAADLCVVHIDGDADLFAARRARRSAERDQHRTPPPPAPPPVIPVLAIDGELTVDQQLRRVLAELGCRAAGVGGRPSFRAKSPAGSGAVGALPLEIGVLPLEIGVLPLEIGALPLETADEEV